MNETDIKYLAGLLDADGSFFIAINNKTASLTIALDLSTGIDRNCEYTEWLSQQLGVKYYRTHRELNVQGVDSLKIVISKRATIEMLVPRLLKYLVIKGSHLNRLINQWKLKRGRILSEEEIIELKQFNKDSRLITGPLKIKSWLPKAYVAGFIDGDGCYFMKKSSGSYNVSTVSHIGDRIVTDLLHKQYGGRIVYQEDWIRWVRPLGKTNKQFAVTFLRDMHRHSRLKKHKIEMFLHYHSQRLNENTSTEDIIV